MFVLFHGSQESHAGIKVRENFFCTMDKLSGDFVLPISSHPTILKNLKNIFKSLKNLKKIIHVLSDIYYNRVNFQYKILESLRYTKITNVQI